MLDLDIVSLLHRFRCHQLRARGVSVLRHNRGCVVEKEESISHRAIF